MKNLLFVIVLLLFSFTSFSQNKSEYNIVGYDNFERPIIEFVEYNQEGFILQKGQYVDQKPHGIWFMYNQNREIISTMNFQFGERIWMKTTMNGKETTIYYEENKPYKLIALLN